MIIMMIVIMIMIMIMTMIMIVIMIVIQGWGWKACTPVELNTYNKQNNYTLCMHNSKDISNLQHYKCNMST